MDNTQIQVLIDEIRNETVIGANTKERIATVLEEIKNNTRDYKVYTAILSQVGTDAPIAIELENTIGVITWVRDDIGIYRALGTGLFTINKTYFEANTGDGYSLNFSPECNYSIDEVYLEYGDISGITVGGTTPLYKDITGGGTKTVEIRVYN